jgi:group I intron endonuclease
MNHKTRYYFIYQTINLITGHFYIGVHTTCNINDGYLGSGKRLKRSICKYGRSNFRRVILDYFNTWREALAAESLIIDKEILAHPLNINIKTGGLHGAMDRLPDEWKQKIAEAHRGKVGHKHTDEARAKIRFALIGRKHSEETKYKIGSGNRGKKLSGEELEKQLARNSNPERCQKISNALMGHKHSEETKQKLREAKINNPMSEEGRAKIRESNKRRAGIKRRFSQVQNG